jgi:hypothetical protein
MSATTKVVSFVADQGGVSAICEVCGDQRSDGETPIDKILPWAREHAEKHGIRVQQH